MTENHQEAGGAGDEREGVTEADILEDLRSRYATVLCPVHGVPPQFDKDEAGGIIEAFCCEALGQIFGELRAGDDGGNPDTAGPAGEP